MKKKILIVPWRLKIVKATVKKKNAPFQPHATARRIFFGPSKTQHFVSLLFLEIFWDQVGPNVLSTVSRKFWEPSKTPILSTSGKFWGPSEAKICL